MAKSSVKRYLCIDTETGGFDPNYHALLSIGVIAWELDPSGQAWILDTLHLPIKPFKALGVSADALAVQGLTWAALDSPHRLDEVETLARFSTWIDAYRDYASGGIWAHNAPFDRGFLEAAIKRHYNRPHALYQYVGRHAPWVCTINTANLLIATRCMDLPEDGLSLNALSKHLGVIGRTNDKAHDALEDAHITVRVAAGLIRRGGVL